MLTFNNVILPVTLVQFDAYWLGSEQKSARIVWTVYSEIDLDFYELQKLTTQNAWLPLETVKAAGMKSYSVEDMNTERINYYRLKFADRSGSFEYSRVIMLVDHKQDIISSDLFPNPADDYVCMKINSPDDFAYCYKIISNSGQFIKEKNAMFRSSSDALRINISDLSSGTYTLELTIPAFSAMPFYKTLIKN
jgi:hypothetical protein